MIKYATNIIQRDIKIYFLKLEWKKTNRIHEGLKGEWEKESREKSKQ